MLSAVAAGKQGPRNHRAGNLDFCLPPADFLVSRVSSYRRPAFSVVTLPARADPRERLKSRGTIGRFYPTADL